MRDFTRTIRRLISVSQPNRLLLDESHTSRYAVKLVSSRVFTLCSPDAFNILGSDLVLGIIPIKTIWVIRCFQPERTWWTQRHAPVRGSVVQGEKERRLFSTPMQMCIHRPAPERPAEELQVPQRSINRWRASRPSNYKPNFEVCSAVCMYWTC